MLRADIAVGAGGVSALERASLGLPSLVATIANNQRAPAEAMADRGAIVLLGPANLLSERDWAVGLLGLCSDVQRLSEMGRAAAALVDCWGADRVAAAMLGVGDVAVAMRRAYADDEVLFLDWANDPGVRRSAFNEAPITAAGHREWFARRLTDPRTAMFVATGPAGLPIGQVRLDIDETGSSALIDISVDPALRGKGVGTAMLAATEECARRLPGLTRLVAQVRHGNHPSRMMFLAAGFSEVATVRDGIYTFELKVRERL
jgi:RimJ/RimL family protein N-acetyltransferase